MFKKAIIFMAILLSVGCSTTHPITLLSPEKRSDLLLNCQTVIEGILVDVISRADMTVGENLDLGGSPSHPANGWKHDYVIEVEHVLKGVCNDSTLSLRDMKQTASTPQSYSQLGILPGAKVNVGWQSESGGNYSGLMLVRAEDFAATQTTTSR